MQVFKQLDLTFPDGPSLVVLGRDFELGRGKRGRCCAR